MKILVVEPMKPCEVREIPDTLEAMQALVGGCIQAVYPFQEEVVGCATRRAETWICPITVR